MARDKYSESAERLMVVLADMIRDIGEGATREILFTAAQLIAFTSDPEKALRTAKVFNGPPSVAELEEVRKALGDRVGLLTPEGSGHLTPRGSVSIDEIKALFPGGGPKKETLH